LFVHKYSPLKEVLTIPSDSRAFEYSTAPTGSVATGINKLENNSPPPMSYNVIGIMECNIK